MELLNQHNIYHTVDCSGDVCHAYSAELNKATQWTTYQKIVTNAMFTEEMVICCVFCKGDHLMMNMCYSLYLNKNW